MSLSPQWPHKSLHKTLYFRESWSIEQFSYSCDLVLPPEGSKHVTSQSTLAMTTYRKCAYHMQWELMSGSDYYSVTDSNTHPKLHTQFCTRHYRTVAIMRTRIACLRALAFSFALKIMTILLEVKPSICTTLHAILRSGVTFRTSYI